MRLGIGLVPEDRKRQGLFLEQSILRNAAIAALKPLRINPMTPAREGCAPRPDLAGVKFASVDQPVPVSGGNQQKGCWPSGWRADRPLLLLDEPTAVWTSAPRWTSSNRSRGARRRRRRVLTVSSELE